MVTPTVKGKLVKHLKVNYGFHVTAFGDSASDLPMLKNSDQRFVVVGMPRKRSNSMNTQLDRAIKQDKLHYQQILLPPGVAPRILDDADLPIMTDFGNGDAVVQGILSRHEDDFKLFHLTDKVQGQLLATDTINPNIVGPRLQEAHERIGSYLALEFIIPKIGVETFSIQQGEEDIIDGHRLEKEDKTCIIPMTHGGEPMARGVMSIFPDARFVHANEPKDVELKHIQGIETIIFVASAIDTDKTVVKFIEHIYDNLKFRGQKFVVTGVADCDAVGKNGLGGTMAKDLLKFGKVDFIALHISNAPLKGKGAFDTCARLFNTIGMEDEDSTEAQQ